MHCPKIVTPMLAVALAAIVPAPALVAQASHDHAHGGAHVPSDSGFAAMQSRGAAAMGVDQYTSAHRFEDRPDGGRIELQRDPNDRAGVETIRVHLRSVALRFTQGDFATPGFVHAGEVPGTAVMRARRAAIEYRFDSLPGGGEVRIVTGDSAAIRAVHEFLAFQRREHRVEATTGKH